MCRSQLRYTVSVKYIPEFEDLDETKNVKHLINNVIACGNDNILIILS